MTVNVNVNGPQGNLEHSLAVGVGGLDITITDGNVHYEGVDRSIGTDIVFTVTNRPEETDLIGYIIDDGANVDIFIDEIVIDGVDVGVDVKAVTGKDIICRLFRARIPPNTSDLDGVDFYVKHFTKDPE